MSSMKLILINFLYKVKVSAIICHYLSKISEKVGRRVFLFAERERYSMKNIVSCFIQVSVIDILAESC